MANKTPAKTTGKLAGAPTAPQPDVEPVPRRLGFVRLDRVTIEDGHNPRQDFDAEALEELTASIKVHGVLQPILVRDLDGAGADTGDGYYALVAGERRFRAAKAAGLTEIPALIGEDAADPQAAKLAALVENVQRENLSAVEEAHAAQAMIEGGLTQVQIAATMGKSERWLRERLRILKLPPEIQQAIAEERLSTTAVRELERIAEISPNAAKRVATVLQDGTVTTADFLENPADAIYEAAYIGGTDDAGDGMGLIDFNSNGGIELKNLSLPDIIRVDLIQRAKAAAKLAGMGPSSYVPLEDDASKRIVEQAREAGKLLEFEIKGNGNTPWIHNYIAADPDFWSGIAQQAVHDYEQRAKTAADKRAKEAAKPRSDDPVAAIEERRLERRAEQQAIDMHAKPYAEQMNTALGRKLRGMTAIDLDGPAAQLLLTLAAGHTSDIGWVVERGLALCDPAFAEPGAGARAAESYVETETDPKAAAAFIVSAWLAYYYADRRANPDPRNSHPCTYGHGSRIGVDHRDQILEPLRYAAAKLKILPGTRAEDYLQAVLDHAVDCQRFGREGNRRRVLLELSEAPKGTLEWNELVVAVQKYRYDVARYEASMQMYSTSGGAVDAALEDLVDGGLVTRTDKPAKDDDKPATITLKITKPGKDAIAGPGADVPLFPSIDPEDPLEDAAAPRNEGAK